MVVGHKHSISITGGDGAQGWWLGTNTVFPSLAVMEHRDGGWAQTHYFHHWR